MFLHLQHQTYLSVQHVTGSAAPHFLDCLEYPQYYQLNKTRFMNQPKLVMIEQRMKQILFYFFFLQVAFIS